MRNYVELSLTPDLETPLYYLWQKVFQQIHIALAENKNSDGESAIGVSFPEYDAAEFSLGTKLRLFAQSEQELKQFQCEKWLERLSDYVSIGEIRAVPEHVSGYACFSQVKPKGSRENLARRRARRTGESYEEALKHFEGYQQEISRLPFIHMQSVSNGHKFKLFIQQKITAHPIQGPYSCYGLSGRSTVPIF